MEEVAHLIIRVSSDQADSAKAKLKQLGFQAKETETATGGLMSMWKGLTGLLAGTVGIGTAIAGLRKLMDVAKQFESLEAQLKTATGTAENAKIAFDALTDFATTTPYDLAQSVEAFIRLTNLGLTPSERALRSYGDTASAMGKDLSQMVQAVANATTGEFEMLKQFGIKARTETDGISMSFRGVTTKVKNDARSIEEYFISLGETNFSGAMIERMATLEGKLSNLGDAWDQMFAAISKAGAGDLMKQLIDDAIAAIEELTAMISSGELGGYIEALAFKFSSLGEIVVSVFNDIADVAETSFKATGGVGQATVDFLIGAFKNFPENVAAFIKAGGWAIEKLMDYAGATAAGIYETFTATFDYLIETAINVGKEVWSHLKPGASDFDYTAAQAAAFEQFSVKANAALESVGEVYGQTTKDLEAGIVAIVDERDARVASFDAQIKASQELRKEYDKRKQAEEAANNAPGRPDRLAGFGKGGKSATAEFEKLRQELRSQEQVLADSYAKRKQLILDNTEAESKLRGELLVQLESRYGEERKQLLDKAGLDLDVKATALEDANAIELQLLNDGYAERQRALDDALAARIISEEEYARRSKQNEERRTREVAALATNSLAQIKTKQLQVYSDVLSISSDIAGQLSDLVSENNDAAKAMFVASKAIAIAQAIVNTELAATKALAEGGFFAGIPMSTIIRTTGYASVGLMAAQAVQEYENGGMIPSGKVGITQEAGFELVRGPAVVTSARATADQLAGRAGGGDVNVQLVINNQAGVEIEQQTTETDDGKKIELFIKRAEKQIASGIRTGGSPVSKALETAYPLRRGAA